MSIRRWHHCQLVTCRKELIAVAVDVVELIVIRSIANALVQEFLVETSANVKIVRINMAIFSFIYLLRTFSLFDWKHCCIIRWIKLETMQWN